MELRVYEHQPEISFQPPHRIAIQLAVLDVAKVLTQANETLTAFLLLIPVSGSPQASVNTIIEVGNKPPLGWRYRFHITAYYSQIAKLRSTTLFLSARTCVSHQNRNRGTI